MYKAFKSFNKSSLARGSNEIVLVIKPSDSAANICKNCADLLNLLSGLFLRYLKGYSLRKGERGKN